MAEGQQQCMYVYVCVCVYNKTQIQMAFYATRFGMHGRRVRGRGGVPSQHVSHVFHYVRQTA